MSDTAVRLRPATAADLAFLCEMLHEANHWSLPPDAPRPPLADDLVSRYVDDWGRPGDAGIVTEVDGTPVGAYWLRLFAADHHGWGFVAPDIPEPSIAVALRWRRRGIGPPPATPLSPARTSPSARTRSTAPRPCSLRSPRKRAPGSRRRPS